MSNLGLYIHIPFCSSKCPYCDFYSNSSTENEINNYVTHIRKIIAFWAGKLNRTVDTIYFGGGTPSVIGTEKILEILQCACESFTISSNPEITIEVNPRSGRLLNFKELKRFGVNRISLGVQSANEEELAKLGRTHNNNDVIYTATQAQKSGIANISMDLMVGIALQTKESLIRSIDFCNTLGCTHLSAYLLKVEPDTPYNVLQADLNLPDDDLQADLYKVLCETTSGFKYNQYEISNFSKPGFESKHNLKYWSCDDYLGIGPSAHSFIDGKRFFYKRNLNDFYQNIITEDSAASPQQEYAMLQLRLSHGLRTDLYRKRFGANIPKRYYQNTKPFTNAGFILCDDEGIRITQKGFLVSNALIEKIVFE